MSAALEEDLLDLEVMIHEAEWVEVLERERYLCSGCGEGQTTPG
jgi:hypothetical protein